MKSPLHRVLDRVYRFPHNVNLYDLLRQVYSTEAVISYLREKAELIDRKGFTWWWTELDLDHAQKVCDLMEKRYGPFEAWTGPEEGPRAQDLLGMFAKINSDCSTTKEQVIPLTNVDYYAEQIQNIYDIPQDRCVELAQEMAGLAKWVEP